MSKQKREAAEKHIKTHTERSAQDRAAVSVLTNFLRFDGRINTAFSCDDKWPNTDGTFEYVPNPEISRQPKQNFCVQIKGTHHFSETDDVVKYQLPNLAFPSFIYCDVTLDPGILFVVINPDQRNNERVFWKYMSADFVHSIDYNKGSITINFAPENEIKYTNESLDAFCEKISRIVDHHSFVKQLDSGEFSRKDMEKIIKVCSEQITESINQMDLLDDSREDVSRKILTRLHDMCVSTLLLNMLTTGIEKVSLRVAWERSLLSVETKYLGTFLKSLKYIGIRIPDDGQSERLMLKYYDFLWQIRKFLNDHYNIAVLHNLEKFPLKIDELDCQYYSLVADSICSVDPTPNPLSKSRFYVQKKTPFFIGTERYYEVTMQLADVNATKYNRVTAYTKANISTNYSVRVGYSDATISIWDIDTKIKVITNWKVSIEPSCLNKLSKILRIPTKLTSRHGEYDSLMDFLTNTGINLLDLIDLQNVEFSSLVDSIYKATNTSIYKKVLQELKDNYSKTSYKFGQHVVRYLIINLREETLERVLPFRNSQKYLCDDLYLSTSCFPFEKNPFISNLAGSRTSEGNLLQSIINITESNKLDVVRPYLILSNAIKRTGDIYFEASSIASEEAINRFNNYLDSWEQKAGHYISQNDGLVCINSYEKTTIDILQTLLRISNIGTKGQKEYNNNFIKQSKVDFSDSKKKQAVQDAFVESQLLLIYGAAGTGKTTLINYISNLMAGRKLFLTKTHAALQNLKRRIDNPGASFEFIGIDKYTKSVTLQDYDIVFIDECSAIDNKTILDFLNKMNPNTFLVLAGDIYQIESIDFGNWFLYAKELIKTYGANVELLSTWRTEDEALISLWNEVRNRNELITEKLAIDGPFSEDIGSNIFNKEDDDEVILCLNYDGKFGLNNINNYFQNANKLSEAVVWQEWSYKVGDPILFNDTKRFSLLYNNLKGRIVEICKKDDSITFTIDVELSLTERDCISDGIEFVDAAEHSTRVRFSVFTYNKTESDDDTETSRLDGIVPFQLAYAVSIHKAQGLEYNSVKVIIPSSNSEKITHGIFYTAITRAKKKLKIFWSAETMKEVVKSFSEDEPRRRSLEIVKSKL